MYVYLELLVVHERMRVLERFQWSITIYVSSVYVSVCMRAWVSSSHEHMHVHVCDKGMVHVNMCAHSEQ